MDISNVVHYFCSLSFTYAKIYVKRLTFIHAIHWKMFMKKRSSIGKGKLRHKVIKNIRWNILRPPSSSIVKECKLVGGANLRCITVG